MALPRVFVTRLLPGRALERLEGKAQLSVWREPRPPPREVLLEEARSAQGLITLLTDRVDEGLLAAAPQLKVVSNVAVGVDNVDLAACSARGIPVGHTPGVLTETTADFAFALLLAAARRLTEADRYVREGRWTTWDPNLLLGRDVFGATLGIVGLGAIGSAVARRARAFSMRILYSGTRKPEREQALGVEHRELPALLAEADFVTLHAPLTDATRGLIGAAELARMRPHAILVNTARGGLVDQVALAAALKAGTIGGAALDVTTPEPLPGSDALLAAPNLTVAPHIGSASVATRSRMAELAVENLLAGLAGAPLPHCANARR